MTFETKSTLHIDGRHYIYFNLKALHEDAKLAKLPYSLKILLENLLRHEDGGATVGDEHIKALLNWDAKKNSNQEISFMPSRVVLQDFTGVPCIVDLAAIREAVVALGGKADQVNPQIPSELVIDHSIQVDVFGRPEALDLNGQIEFERNKERYAFLKWGQGAFGNFKVVPPNTGIVHQVNLEHLARVVMETDKQGEVWLYPDTVFGTDSHTTMINGLGVLGWGVGGIEAEAAMLGEPSSMLIPEVIGFELTGKLPEGSTATDLVLTITQMLRQFGVVGKFVEFFGPGLSDLSLADRATIANMAPEYGATCGLFPIDQETLNYLHLSGRSEHQVTIVEAYAKAQGFWHDENSVAANYSNILRLNLQEVEPSLAGPKRPQDRLVLSEVPQNFKNALLSNTPTPSVPAKTFAKFKEEGGAQPQSEYLPIPPKKATDLKLDQMTHGSVVIAAITSCTNTSNPAVMLAAGLLAKKAVEAGLQVKPWVKTSLGPGSRVVTDYLEQSHLLPYLEKLGFFTVGYGCTTCIGNSGPLPDEVSQSIQDNQWVVSSVLSGNRNFEGRVHPEVKTNYLASPPLVVAYALAGNIQINLTTEPLGYSDKGKSIFLKDIWPSNQEIHSLIQSSVRSELFNNNYQHVFHGDARWQAIPESEGMMYKWDTQSTYIKNPPYFNRLSKIPAAFLNITGARILGIFGDSITTDHISPAGNIKKDSPAGQFLQLKNIKPVDFNSYGSRRGNDDVMIRGTFANIRIKNLVLGGEEGGNTFYYHGDDREKMSIYEAAKRYQKSHTPLIVIAGKEYGTGSSRDWAAKGTLLLGVKIVIAESFERIHRANLVGMGVLPLQFKKGENAQSLGLDGSETIDLINFELGKSQAQIKATRLNGNTVIFNVNVLLLTPKEVTYYRHGGVLPYVVRKMAKKNT